MVCRNDDSDSGCAKVLQRQAFMREVRDVLVNRKSSLVVTAFNLRIRYHDDDWPILSQALRQSVASILKLVSTLNVVVVYCRQHASNERLFCLVQLGFPDFEDQNEAVL